MAVGRAAPTPEERHPWSIRVGRLFGIPIDVHVTFVLLLAWIALGPLVAGAPIEKGLASAAFTVLVFGIVVLHELGHALVARRFGCATRRILLLPIGGIASIARPPTRPREEILVAIAGPAVNVALAALVGAYLRLRHGSLGLDQVLESDALGARLFWTNVGLAAFNLLPAFPMDGGRVLRASLAVLVDRARATELAAWIGRGVAVLLGVLGLVFQPMLALVALFVWSAGRAEAYAETTRASLAGVRVAQVMAPDVDPLPGEAALGDVARRILDGNPHDVVVVDEGVAVGLLTRGDVLRGLARGDVEAPIRTLMHHPVVTAAPDEPLLDALERLASSHLGTLLVVDGERVVGIVDAESIGERMVLEGALARRSGRGGAVRPASG